MSELHFRPHGHSEAYVEGSVLVVTVSGYWNLEMHAANTKLTQPLVERLEAQGPWGTVVVVTDTLVSSIEVFEAARRAVAESSGISGLVALAWAISPQVEGYGLMLPRYRRMYEGLLPSEIFPTVDAAREWVEAAVLAAKNGEKSGERNGKTG